MFNVIDTGAEEIFDLIMDSQNLRALIYAGAVLAQRVTRNDSQMFVVQTNSPTAGTRRRTGRSGLRCSRRLRKKEKKLKKKEHFGLSPKTLSNSGSSQETGQKVTLVMFFL